MDNDLIRRSALKQDLLARGFWPVIVKCAVEAAPAVDAVEVVRCGECEYLEGEECVNPYLALNNEAHFYPDNDFFCASGERRNDGT